ncbi:MAG: hypothetical protein KAI66_21075 [Lentisphaeria bacterium]|nr:hypothetical protein [Lentisphaeria bacterium]
MLPLSYVETETRLPGLIMDFLIMPSLGVRFRSCCQAWVRAGAWERRWLERSLELDGKSLERGVRRGGGIRHEHACLRRMNPALTAFWLHLAEQALLTSPEMAVFLDEQGLGTVLRHRSAGRLSRAQLETLVLGHPLWLEALASFQYETALGIVPAVLATIGLPELRGDLEPVLVARLEQERALVSAVEFPWLAVAKTLDASNVPDLWEGRTHLTKKERTMLGVRNLKLELMGPAQICRAMVGVASRRDMAARRQMLLGAARIFGENRGVRPPMPQL